MPDNRPPSYLEKLRIVQGFLRHQLDQVERWIAEEEHKQQERQHGEQTRPPAPDWVLELGLNRDSPAVYVHEGGCWNAGKRSRGVPRDVALRALAEGVPACPHCRPDSALGYLEG